MMPHENYLLAHYKGFFARIWFDDGLERWCGRILDIDDLVVFDGKTIEEALETFHAGIEKYMETKESIKNTHTQVLNMIRWRMEMPDFEEAARQFLSEENV